MTLINSVPHLPTLHFYRRALRVLRVDQQQHVAPSTAAEIQWRGGQLLPQLSHLQRKLRANVRDGIRLYQDERQVDTVALLIHEGEQDLDMIRAWKHVDPIWVERIFKPPTVSKKDKKA
ncbi:hypothetical protein DFQ27_007516 [Actinomortierella ambigua]|uniref:Uncharacterized protein n=1 Tax=Actinomortierella ambigua TaxID=1343610 RepID=A0A9P6PVA9_9FUNG|nr:hypothetical protein DFQ27_007516 [Actinomortierella ambigua]